jgi:YHS domain-containing protein
MKTRKQQPTHKDPVCGMEVSPKTAAATAGYAGKTYYFCAPGCRDKFQSQPESYVRSRERP